MPKYIKSRDVQGIDYVLVDGVSYHRTGSFLPISSTTTTPLSDVTAMYVSSCSAADRGQFNLSEGGTLTIPSSGEFQMKFAGGSAGDTGILVLDDNGSTCNVLLSVNAIDNLVWDAGIAPTGTPNGYEFVNYPHTFSYTDCNSNIYDVTLAGLGSFFITVKKTGITVPSTPAPSGCSGILYSSTHALDLSGIGNQGQNWGVDACFTSQCIGWHAGAHHYRNMLYNGPWGADIYAYYPTPSPGNAIYFILSLIDRNTGYPTFNRAALEAASGSTVCADCAGLSAHSFMISGANVTGSLYDPTGTFGAGELGSDWAIPCAGCGGGAQSLVLAISGQAGTAPINWSTGLDAHGNQALYCINFTGDDWEWTLSKYTP